MATSFVVAWCVASTMDISRLLSIYEEPRVIIASTSGELELVALAWFGGQVRTRGCLRALNELAA